VPLEPDFAAGQYEFGLALQYKGLDRVLRHSQAIGPSARMSQSKLSCPGDHDFPKHNKVSP